MSKKAKGLSFDQKKEAMLKGMLYEATIYNMQELESLAKKHRVIPQAVKEVIEALLSERLICMEKIGTQNIYWSFPSQRKAGLLAERDRLTQELDSATRKLADAETTAESAKALVKLSDKERLAIINETSYLTAQEANLHNELRILQANDPRKIQKKIEELKQANADCTMWTSNVFVVRQHYTNGLGISESDVNERFGISEDFDYL